MKYVGKLVLIALFAVALAACSGSSQEAPAEEVNDPLEDFVPLVSATGKVVPARWATLSLPSGGIIAELMVEENDAVAEGEALLRLDGSEAAEAAVTAARLELVAAIQALNDVEESAGLTSAEAMQAVADARDAVRDAERRVNNLTTASPQSDVDQARANVVIAKDKLDDAWEDFEPYENKPEDNVERARFLSQLAQAQKDYDAAVRLLNNLEGAANEIDLSQAEADLVVAEAALKQAITDLEDRQSGPDPDLLEQASVRLENAQAQVAAAQAALEDLTLEAPFPGTVSALYVRRSEWVNAGQPVVLIGDLENLWIETTDLNEIDVARLEVGSAATVSFDALPDVVVNGRVMRIAPKASEGTGVNYTVVVELEEIPAGLLWDMTAFVDVEVE